MEMLLRSKRWEGINLITIKNVSKNIGKKKIIDDISLDIYKGEITFIVGSSGAGKSTLLNLIGGLDTISSGEILYNGENIGDDLTVYRAKHVGFVFQEYNLISGLSVKENINLGLYYCGKEENMKHVDEHLKNLGVKDMEQTVETLSGGEKQRTAIARTVCKESDIILADEPSGNLDSTNAEIVFELLSKLKKDKHVIIVTHDLEKANQYGDRIITIKDGRVEEDCRINLKPEQEREEKEKFKNHQVSFKSVFLLGINSIKLRKTKIISIAFVLALAISSIAMSIHFSQSGNTIAKNVNVNYLESDLIDLFYPQTMNLGYKETPFDNQEIEHIMNTYDVKHIVPIYAQNDSWFFSIGSMMKDAVLKQITIDGFFEERVMSNDIEGGFITGDNEIILASDVAETLFEGNCIGKEIFLNDGGGNNISFTIVGINHTVNASDKIYSFVSSNKVKELLEKQIDTMISSHLSLEKYYTEVVDIKTGFIYGAMKTIQESETILYGKAATGVDEVTISSALLPYVLGGMENGNSYSESDILSGKIPESIFEGIEKQRLAIKCNGLFEVHICGVFQSGEIELRCTNELLEELKHLEPTELQLYVSNAENVISVMKDINRNESYTAESKLESLKDNVSMQTRFFELSILLLGIIMVIISFFMLASFSNISVLERKKEVGIMKSLGAGNKNVLYTLWFDTVIISISAFLMALLVTGIFILLLPHIMTNIGFIEFTYPIQNLVGIGIIFLIVIVVYTILGMKKLVKNVPAVLLK